jgi:hypothetical protein
MPMVDPYDAELRCHLCCRAPSIRLPAGELERGIDRDGSSSHCEHPET